MGIKTSSLCVPKAYLFWTVLWIPESLQGSCHSHNSAHWLFFNFILQIHTGLERTLYHYQETALEWVKPADKGNRRAFRKMGNLEKGQKAAYSLSHLQNSGICIQFSLLGVALHCLFCPEFSLWVSHVIFYFKGCIRIDFTFSVEMDDILSGACGIFQVFRALRSFLSQVC